MTMQQIGDNTLFPRPLFYLHGYEMKSGCRPENARQMHTSMQALMKKYQIQSRFFSGGINLGELGHGHTQCTLSVEMNPKHYYNLTLHYRDLYHGCNHWTNQIGSLEVLNLIDTS